MTNAIYVMNCYNSGNVTATANAAGLINQVSGFLQDRGGIQNCSNTGAITGNGIVAGVLGNQSVSGYQQMRFCYNTGEITAGASSTVVGGVFGSIGRYSYPSYCYNAGDILSSATAPTSIGGVVASAATDNFNYVSYAHNYGKITIAEGSAPITGAIMGGSNISSKCSNLYYRADCIVSDETPVIPADAGMGEAMTAQQFSLAEVAYRLDNGNSALRTYYWSQGPDYPVFAASDETAVYRVTVAAVANGALIPMGENYGKGGAEMTFTANAQTGYKLGSLVLKDVDDIHYSLNVAGNAVSFSMPTANTTLTAAFVEGSVSDTTHTVKLMSENEVFQTLEVISGHTFKAPAAKPERAGYVFKGWYTSKEYHQLYNFNSLVYQDLILYARWVEAGSETITVSFNLNGAAGSAPEKQIIALGDFVSRPVTPVWESEEPGFRYQFEGWYTAKVGGSLWDFEADQPLEDMILWAHWTRQDSLSSGTQDNPYVITSYEELKQLSENVVEGFGYGGSYFILGNDIAIEDADWSGIGYIKASTKNDLRELAESGTVPFNGNFDGDGYTIFLHEDQKVAFFGAVGSPGEIYNLNVEGVLHADPDNEREIFGGIAGVHFGLIDSCHAVLTAGEGDLETDGNVSIWGGGIVGGLAAGTIRDCTAMVQMYNRAPGSLKCFGGIVGYVVRGGIEDCTVKTGSIIDDTVASPYVDYGSGGISGAMTSDLRADGTNSYMIGCTVEQGVIVRGATNAGGLTGYGTLINNCRTGASVYVQEGKSASAFAGTPQTIGEEGISNSYYYGSFVQSEDDIVLGTVTNCYYGFVDDEPLPGTATESTRATYVTEAQLASGEVAYLLDGGEGIHSHTWTQGDGYPVQGTPSYYPIKGMQAENGSISIDEQTDTLYRGEGSTIQVTVSPREYKNERYGPQYAYQLTSLIVRDSQGNLISSTANENFVMPDGSVELVEAIFTLEQIGENIKEDPREEEEKKPEPGNDDGDGTAPGTGDGGIGDGSGSGDGGEGEGGVTDGGGAGDSGTPSGETAPDSRQNVASPDAQSQTPPAEPIISELEAEPEEEQPEEEQPQTPQPPEQPEEEENILDESPEITEATQRNTWPVIALITVVAVSGIGYFISLLLKRRGL